MCGRLRRGDHGVRAGIDHDDVVAGGDHQHVGVGRARRRGTSPLTTRSEPTATLPDHSQRTHRAAVGETRSN